MSNPNPDAPQPETDAPAQAGIPPVADPQADSQAVPPANPPPGSPAKRPRPFLLKLFMGIAYAIIALATIVFLVLTVEGWRGSRKWNNYKKGLEAKGEVLDLKAMAPPPIPDEKNFAKYPLMAQMFVRQPGDGPGNNPKLPTPGLADPDHEKYSSGPSRKKGDLRTALMQWSDYYTGHAKFPQAAAGSSPAQIVSTALGIYDADIQGLQQAMAERPLCRYPLDYREGFVMLLPHLAAVKGLASTIQVRALADLHLGKADKAFNELRLGFFVGDTLEQDPLLISQLVHIAMDTILWDAVKEGLCLRRWNEQQLAWFVDYLGKRNYLADYQASMRAERNFAIYGIEMLRQGRVREVVGEEGGSGGQLTLKMLPNGIFYHNLYYLVKLHHDYSLPAVDPKIRQVNKDAVQNFEDAVNHMGTSPYTIYARLLLPALSKVAIKTARWQTYGDVTMMACAMERHRLATGTLPKTLGELAPKFMPFVPKDVVNGEPFVLKVANPDTYQIYMFGWDERDDRGVVDARAERGDWGFEIAPVSMTTTR
jgi:hypothetical protein